MGLFSWHMSGCPSAGAVIGVQDYPPARIGKYNSEESSDPNGPAGSLSSSSIPI